MIFEQELNKALSGEVYKKFGLNSDPFTPIPKRKINSFVNREHEQRQIARAIANQIKREITHIPILGAHGVGKSHFLYYTYEAVKKMTDKLGVSGVKFVEGVQHFKDLFWYDTSATEYNVRECPYIKELGDNANTTILFLDDLDVIFNRFPKIVSDLLEMFKGGIIGTWNTREWKNAKRAGYVKIPKTEVIYLELLEPAQCSEILKRRIEHSKISSVADDIFPNYVINRLSMSSNGNPYKLITIAKRYLNFIINKNIVVSDTATFREFFNMLHTTFVMDVKNKVEGITEKQAVVLRFVVDKVEVNSNDVREFLGTTRVAAVQHLHALKGLGLLHLKPKGRSVFFYVPTEMIEDVDDGLDRRLNKDDIE